MSGRHAAGWAVSGEREMDAPPYVGRHRMEPGVESPRVGGCETRSPGGWYCCLPEGHGGNHIGTTQGFGRLYQWPSRQGAQDEDDRCASCGHYWQDECACGCCRDPHEETPHG